jgi:hypothetical protein
MVGVLAALSFVIWPVNETAITQWYKEPDFYERYRLKALTDARWDKKMAKKGYVKEGAVWRKL